jgi:uncharacterized repeat protein (TIGR01451 family)
VINTGNVFLTNIVVVDDKGLSVVCPAPNLNPGEAMACLASGFAGIGTYSNVGTVTANHDAFNVTASDPSSYFGANPLLTLKKFTNGAEAPDIPVGNSVNWTYLVKNTGNVTVSGISVTDDQGVVVTCPQSVLLIDEEMTCTGSGVATAGWYRNLGTVNGSFEQTNVSAQDSSTYYGSAPAITLEKTTNGSDNPTIPVGSPVAWVYRVTNTGNVDIDSVVVTDNQGVLVTCPKTALLIGEIMQCAGSGTAIAGNYSNIGTVTANYKGLQITANDSSSYFGSAPSIDVQKTPDSQVVIQGQSVTFTVTVTNTGNIPLTNVDVSDPLAPNCNRNFATLAVAEVQTFTCTLTNLQSTFTNIATVTANTGTTTISDSDSAEVLVDILPDITLSKTASISTVPATGGLVDYTIRISNIGGEDVILTSLSDTQVTLSPSCTALIGQTVAAGSYLECVISGVNVVWTGSSTFINTATAVGTDPQQNADTASASATVTFGWYGRTPGYWKNHPEDWTSGYTPTQYVQDVFTVPSTLLKLGILDVGAPSGKDRLIDGLGYQGGSALSGAFQILMRAAIAALLNEAYYGTYFPGATSTSALIAQVNSALATQNRGSYLALATTLDNWNNAIHSSLP